MNSRRVINEIEYRKYLEKNPISLLWLLGFIEREGTFGTINLKPYFQIGQHVRNEMIISTIEKFLSSLMPTYEIESYSAEPEKCPI